MDTSIDEVLAEEFDRVATIDAALELVDQLTKYRGVVRMLLEQARDDAQVAVVELVNCDPTDATRIRELQWQVKRFNDLLGYVERVIEAGRNAREDLTEEQAAELEQMLGDQSPAKD